MQHAATQIDHETPRHKNVYAYVGQRIKARRKLLKMNQSQLAELMGFSYQQIQKYESGFSQVSVSKLLLFSKILNVAPAYFYEGIKLEDGIGKGISSDIVQNTRTRPLNILLVEDSATDEITFKKALGACSEQATVHVIHDGERVMDFLHNHDSKYGQEKPDIIVMETMLGKASGLPLIRLIKRTQPLMDIPVIVLTNSISKKDMLEAYACGVAGFIQKNLGLQDYSSSVDLLIRYWAKAVVLPNM